MAVSNLTGTFIANTFQKLLQYDNINGSVGTTATFNMADAISSSKYNLLNGLGQTMPGFVIDTTGNGDGGLMFKDSNSDPGIPLFNLGGLWSIQTFKTSNSEGGLNFWRPSGVTNAANAKLFLKNTGSVWVGYQDSASPFPVIPTDTTGYSLYVKNGTQVGQNTAGNNGRINLIGANPLENGAGMFINGEYPFRIVRYKYDEVNDFLGPRTRQLEGDPAGNGNPPDSSGVVSINNDLATNPVYVDKWTAVLVGWTRTTTDRSHMLDRAGAIIHCNPGEDVWRVSFTIAAPQNFYADIGIGALFTPVLQDPLHSASTNNSTGTKDQDWYFDVMFIRKGFYDDYRPKQKGDEGDVGNNDCVWGAA